MTPTAFGKSTSHGRIVPLLIAALLVALAVGGGWYAWAQRSAGATNGAASAPSGASGARGANGAAARRFGGVNRVRLGCRRLGGVNRLRLSCRRLDGLNCVRLGCRRFGRRLRNL